MSQEGYPIPEPVMLARGLAAFAAVTEAYAMYAEHVHAPDARRARQVAQAYYDAANSPSPVVVTDRATSALVRHAARTLQELTQQYQRDHPSDEQPQKVLEACDEVLEALAEGAENLGRAVLGEGANEEGKRRKMERVKRINEERRKQRQQR